MSEQTSSENGNKAAKGKGKRRLLLKIAGAFAVVVVAALVFLPYLLPTAWIESMAARGLEGGLKRPVSVRGVSWGWLSGVTIGKISVSELDEFGGGEFLNVGGISLRVSLGELLKWRVRVNSIVVDSPKVTLVKKEDGKWNFEDMGAGVPLGEQTAEAQGGGMPMEVSIDSVRVTDGGVVVKDMARGTAVEARNIDLSVEADFSKPVITGSAKLSIDVAQAGGSGSVEVAATSFEMPKPEGGAGLKGASASGTIELQGVDIGELMTAVAPEAGGSLGSGKLSVAVIYDLKGGAVSLKAENGKVAGLSLKRQDGGTVKIGDVGLGFEAEAASTGGTMTAKVSRMDIKTDFATASASAAYLEAGGVKDLKGQAKGTFSPGRLPAGLVELPEGLEISGAGAFEVEFAGDPKPGRFSAVVDASGLGLSGAGLAKQAGTTAKMEISGLAGAESVSADRFVVTLSGGAISGSGLFDLATKAATWKGAVDLAGVNIADYAQAKEQIVASGKATYSGEFFLEEPKRSSAFRLDTKFDDFTLDAAKRPGKELSLTGGVSVNSARAATDKLAVTLGGSTLDVNVNIREPLAKPNGRIDISGKNAPLDELMALPEAFAGAEEEEQVQEETKDEGATTLADIYLNTANIGFGVAIDNVSYEGYQGKNLKVDGALSGGKFAVRDSSVEIFGGQVLFTTLADLTGTGKPVEAKVAATGLQSNEALKGLIAKYVPFLQVFANAGLEFAANGSLEGTGDALANSLSGGGRLDLAQGSVAVPGLTGILGALGSGWTTQMPLFEKLGINLKMVNGVLESEYSVAMGKDRMFVEGKVYLAGGYSHTVGMIPEGTSTRVRLLTSKNGQISTVPPQELLSQMMKLTLERSLIKKETEGGAQSKEQQALEAVGGLLQGILKPKEEEKAGEQKE